MPLAVERITVFCFAASYGVALALEVWHHFQPRPIQRLLSLVFGAAGLIAHTAFILVQTLPLATPQGSLLFLAWILAVFYLYGSIHHRRLAWGLFVLPLVLGLVVVADWLPPPEGDPVWKSFHGDRVWGLAHGVLVLLAAVGVCVAFLASVMYLVQSHRLKAKAPPGQGMRLLSLERIEEMNRRAILWAFPLLTAGLLIGVALQWQRGSLLEGWDSTKILGGLGLWVVFAILLYLRYEVRLRGRQAAFLTFVAFGLLIVALLAPMHPFAQGGGPP
ncbi:MAG: cytochrome c biogenesis protein CcsA [Planctomycetes bacterium]|nr:cytochrome c biogenesis protein CcsA [Planctomycetota bacterium]